MERLIQSIIIICEGKSEYCYIDNLNNWLSEFGIILIPKMSNGLSGIVKLQRKVRKDDKRSRIEVWCDEDVFKRGRKKKTKELLKALTNTFNFEDFLVLHLDKQEVIKWQNICKEQGHFSYPMTSNSCVDCIQKIFSRYQKGSLPSEITLNTDTMRRLFQNNNDSEILFRSDFASFLEKILSDNSCHLLE